MGAGADFAGCRSNIVLPPPPVFLVASIDNDIDVNINKIAEIVVAFDSSVADPRGPNAVCEPMPPNAPARSAALPLCSNTTTTRIRHTMIWTMVIRMIIRLAGGPSSCYHGPYLYAAIPVTRSPITKA